MTKENENEDENEDEKETDSNIFYIFNLHFLIPFNAC